VVPDPIEVPPHELVYHCQFAPVPKLPPTTEMFVLNPGVQLFTGLELTDVGSVESTPEVVVNKMHAFAFAVEGVV